MFNRNVSRRQFLAGSAAATGAFALSACRSASAPGSGEDETVGFDEGIERTHLLVQEVLDKNRLI